MQATLTTCLATFFKQMETHVLRHIYKQPTAHSRHASFFLPSHDGQSGLTDTKMPPVQITFFKKKKIRYAYY